MNRTVKTVFAATLAIAVGASVAQTSRNIPTSWANEDMSVNTYVNTRAQVQADLDAARRSGELNAFDNLADMNSQGGRRAPVAPVAPDALAKR